MALKATLAERSSQRGRWRSSSAYRRHRARRHGPARRQPGDRHGGRRRAGRPGRPPSDRLARSARPDAVRRRAVEDELIRGDLVSDDATVTAIIVSFDEDRIDAVRGGVIQRIHDIVDPGLPPGVRATTTAAWRSARPTTGSRSTISASSRRRSCSVHLAAIYVMFRSWRKTVLTLLASASACSGRSASIRCSASPTTSSPA